MIALFTIYITRKNRNALIYRFLKYIGVGKLVKFLKMNFNTKKFDKLKELDRPLMDPETYKHLQTFFIEDIKKLEKLIDKDLSMWTDER